MTHVFRSPLAGPVSALILACSVVACSGEASPGGDSTVGTTGAAPASIKVVQTAMFVSIENQAGQPLVDVAIAIHPSGGRAPYTTNVRRIESGGKQALSFGDFAGGGDRSAARDVGVCVPPRGPDGGRRAATQCVVMPPYISRSAASQCSRSRPCRSPSWRNSS